MKHVDADENKILVANTNGKFYALCDRCSHTAPLHSQWEVSKIMLRHVTCPMHGARFDIKTGKKISDPPMPSINTDSLPPNFQKYVQYVGQILSRIKTYDQKTYEVKIEGNNMGDLDSLMTLIEADSCFVSKPGQLAEIVRA